MDNYNYLFQKASELADTYQFLPPEDVAYPFIVINDSSKEFIASKNNDGKISEETFQVDVWCQSLKRTACKRIIDDLINATKECLNMSRSNYQIVIDNISNNNNNPEILWHGILEVSMYGQGG